MSDFHEDDEPVHEVVSAFDRGQGGVTGHPYPSSTYGCEHVTISGPLVGAPTSYLCDCVMSPVQTS